MLDPFYNAAGVFAFRPDIARLYSKALRAVGGTLTFHAAAVREREHFRHTPRTMRARSVGSTLLLKGLETDERGASRRSKAGRFQRYNANGSHLEAPKVGHRHIATSC